MARDIKTQSPRKKKLVDTSSLPDEVRQDIERWQEESGIEVLKNREGESTLSLLYLKGCDPVRLLSLLNSYRQPLLDPDGNDHPNDLDKQVLSLSKRLAKDAKGIRAVRVRFHALRLAKVEDEMEEASRQLRVLYESSVEPDMSRGSNVAFLTAAVKMVKLATGRPHYAELGALVSILAEKSVDAAMVRINVANFKDRGEIPFLTDAEIRREVRWGKSKWKKRRATS